MLKISLADLVSGTLNILNSHVVYNSLLNSSGSTLLSISLLKSLLSSERISNPVFSWCFSKDLIIYEVIPIAWWVTNNTIGIRLLDSKVYTREYSVIISLAEKYQLVLMSTNTFKNLVFLQMFIVKFVKISFF